MSKTVLLTGATGKVGQEVLKALKQTGATIKAAVRDLAKAESLGVEGVKFDFDEKATWASALGGVDALYLVTPPFHPREVEIGKAIVDAAVAAGVQKIVKLSAMGAENADAFAHKAVDAYVAQAGVDYTILKPSFFMQNFNMMHAETIRGAAAFYLAAADGKTGFVDTRDIAAVAAKALTEPGHEKAEYVLTGSEAIDHHRVAELLSEAAGRPIKYVAISEQDAIAGMKQAGMPENGIEALTVLMGFVRAGYTAVTTEDVKKVLGRAPISFAQYAQDYAAAFK